jgi:hypothetical protein
MSAGCAGGIGGSSAYSSQPPPTSILKVADLGILHSSSDEQAPIAENNLRVQVRFGYWFWRSPDHQVNLARPQFAQRGGKIQPARRENDIRECRRLVLEAIRQRWSIWGVALC